MGRLVLVVYKPRAGKEEALVTLVKAHHAELFAEKLVTERPPVIMKNKNNKIIEIFEWRSKEAIEQAHHNATVQRLWKSFSEVCEYEKAAAGVEEFNDLFAEFEPIDL
jgi:hypothetical protein